MLLELMDVRGVNATMGTSGHIHSLQRQTIRAIVLIVRDTPIRATPCQDAISVGRARELTPDSP